MPEAVKILHPLNVSILKDIQKEWRAQGHFLTGNLERNSENVTTAFAGAVILEGYAPAYSEVLENGVSADRIPYDSSQRTGAKHSAYIEGLKNFAMLKFHLSEKDALGAAFAIAKNHEKEGMPTAASEKHSQTGERRKAIYSTFIKNEDKYFEQMDSVVSENLDRELFQGAVEIL